MTTWCVAVPGDGSRGHLPLGVPELEKSRNNENKNRNDSFGQFSDLKIWCRNHKNREITISHFVTELRTLFFLTADAKCSATAREWVKLRLKVK